MTAPRAAPLVAIILFVVVAVTLVLLWSRGALRHPAEDVRTGGAPTACAPLNPSSPPPADCPQATPPTQRTP